MNLIKRIIRLFKADLHGLLDNLEDPEAVLKQAIREMREAIENTRTAIGMLQMQRDSMAEKEQQILGQQHDIEEQIEFCFAQNNLDLAKSRIRKKLQMALFARVLSKQKQAVCEEIKTLEQELLERQEKLQRILDQQALFAGKNPVDCSVRDGEEDLSCTESVTEEDVEIAFLRELQQRSKPAAASTPGA